MLDAGDTTPTTSPYQTHRDAWKNGFLGSQALSWCSGLPATLPAWLLLLRHAGLVNLPTHLQLRAFHSKTGPPKRKVPKFMCMSICVDFIQ